MTGQLPVPDPVPQPAPGWLLWFLLMLTFVLHVLAMNVVLGGSIVAAVARWRGGSGERPHHLRLYGWMTRALPSAVAAAITLGVAPLLFLQVLYGRLFFSSSVLMAWFWLAVIPLLLAAYGTSYWLAFRRDEPARHPRWGIWVVALLFLAIAFIYANDMSLMLRPGTFLERYTVDGRGLHLNLDDPTLLPRFLHFGLAAVAVAGLVVALVGLLRRRREPQFGAWAMRHGAVWFVSATGLNLLVGTWFLFALPRETVLRLVGGDALGTGALWAGILLGLVAFATMLLAIQAEDRAPWVMGGLAAVLLTVVAMALARDQVRRAALDAAGFEPTAWVVPQWGVIGIFAVLLVAALATVAWMLFVLARGRAAT